MSHSVLRDDLRAVEAYGDGLSRRPQLKHASITKSGDLLQQTAEALQSAQTLDERWAVLVECFAGVGANQLNYGIFALWAQPREQAPVQFLSTMAPDWLDYYAGERLDLHDLHAAIARDRLASPYCWGASGLDHLNDRGRRNTQNLTVEAGLRSSLHVPLSDPMNSLLASGSFTVGSSLSEAQFFAAIAGRHAELIAIVQLFHSLALADMRSNQLPGNPLSARESDCLSYVIDGLRIDAVAERMDLSRATIELHLRNGRQKLGAATLPEAVARGLASGQLSLNGARLKRP